MAKSKIAKSSGTVVEINRRDVIKNERLWHEQEAHKRYGLDALLYGPPAFNDLVDFAFDYLDGQGDELVLDIGCGEGKETLLLAQKGLSTVSMDLSHKQLCRARDSIRAVMPDANVFFVQANAEEPPFASESFRIIHGKAILHHLDLNLASVVVQRLLKPNGKASFAEPLDRHPLFWLGRRLTPQFRTEDEHPLLLHELDTFAQTFCHHETRTFFLLTPLAYVFRIFRRGEHLFQRAYQRLTSVDSFLFSRGRGLKRLAWYSIINVQK